MSLISLSSTSTKIFLAQFLFLTLVVVPNGFAIVNGQVETDFSAVGFVTDGAGNTASAVLIDPYWVLTSAAFAINCSNGSFYLGLDCAAPDAVHAISGFFPHVAYTPFTGEYNIALLRLANPVSLVSPLPYLTTPFSLFEGRFVTFVGYGWTSLQDGSNTVRHSCSAQVQYVQWLSFITFDSGASPYLGDYGGPAMLEIEGVQYVAGLFSDFDPDNFGAANSTRITSFVSFIQNVMENNPPPTGVAPDLPLNRLLNTFPNPFNPTTEISFVVEGNKFCSLAIFDSCGRKVADLVARRFEAGPHTVRWDGCSTNGQNMPSGVYFVLFKVDDHAETRKIVLAR